MGRYVIDTNALLRLFLNDIPEQKEQIENLIKKAKNQEVILYVPQIVLFELSFVLDKYYNIERMEIVKLLQAMSSSDYLKVEDADIFIESLSLFDSIPTLSLRECFLVTFAKDKDANVFTLDKKMKKVAGDI
jgi:predicted nucleic acid-binding protein